MFWYSFNVSKLSLNKRKNIIRCDIYSYHLSDIEARHEEEIKIASSRMSQLQIPECSAICISKGTNQHRVFPLGFIMEHIFGKSGIKLRAYTLR